MEVTWVGSRFSCRYLQTDARMGSRVARSRTAHGQTNEPRIGKPRESKQKRREKQADFPPGGKLWWRRFGWGRPHCVEQKHRPSVRIENDRLPIRRLEIGHADLAGELAQRPFADAKARARAFRGQSVAGILFRHLGSGRTTPTSTGGLPRRPILLGPARVVHARIRAHHQRHGQPNTQNGCKQATNHCQSPSKTVKGYSYHTLPHTRWQGLSTG